MFLSLFSLLIGIVKENFRVVGSFEMIFVITDDCEKKKKIGILISTFSLITKVQSFWSMSGIIRLETEKIFFMGFVERDSSEIVFIFFNYNKNCHLTSVSKKNILQSHFSFFPRTSPS